jgi:hypothetical protein
MLASSVRYPSLAASSQSWPRPRSSRCGSSPDGATEDSMRNRKRRWWFPSYVEIRNAFRSCRSSCCALIVTFAQRGGDPGELRQGYLSAY